MTKFAVSVLHKFATLPQDISASPTQDSVFSAAPAEASTSLIEIIVQGGWIMIPLGLLSILAVYLFIERLGTLRSAQSDPYQLTDRIRRYIQASDVRGAVGYCDAQDNPISRILKRGLERLGRPISEIQDAVQAAGKTRSI